MGKTGEHRVSLAEKNTEFSKYLTFVLTINHPFLFTLCQNSCKVIVWAESRDLLNCDVPSFKRKPQAHIARGLQHQHVNNTTDEIYGDQFQWEKLSTSFCGLDRERGNLLQYSKGSLMEI